MSYKGIWLLSFLSFAFAYGDTNILVNPDFENGIVGWGPRSCQIEAVSTPVHGGAGAAKAYGRTDTWQGISQSVLGKMVQGKTYHVTSWVRLENAPSASITASIDLRDDRGNIYPNIARATATDSNWTLLAGDFTLSDVNGTLSGLDIYFEGPPAGINFYVDDVNVFGPEAQIVKVEVKKAEPNAAAAIDAKKRYQKLEGFGASGAYFTMEFATHQKKTELYNVLFKELGLDIFRIRNNYDMEAKSLSETVEIVKGAKAVVPELKIMMSSWSPPIYLKSDGNTVGGTLKQLNGKYNYAGFAQWWEDSMETYIKAGVNIDYISIQNEPDYLAKWDSCLFAPAETAEKAGYSEALEAVWSKLNAKLGSTCPKILAPEAYGPRVAANYVSSLADLSHVYGYAYHLYDCSGSTTGCGTEPDRYLADLEKFKAKCGDKPSLQTEYFHKEPDPWKQAINTAILMHNCLTAGNAAGYLYWDLFWGPGTTSILSIDNPQSYSLNPVYYTFKQFSAFTDPGWQRIDAATENTGLRMSAYISPDNRKLTAIIINTTADLEITANLSFKDFSISKGEIFRSSKNEKCVKVGDYKKKEPLKLPADSITTLTLSGKSN